MVGRQGELGTDGAREVAAVAVEQTPSGVCGWGVGRAPPRLGGGFHQNRVARGGAHDTRPPTRGQ